MESGTRGTRAVYVCQSRDITRRLMAQMAENRLNEYFKIESNRKIGRRRLFRKCMFARVDFSHKRKDSNQN